MALLDAWIPRLYVRIAPDTVQIRRSHSRAVWNVDAIVAISATPTTRVLAVGAAARLAAAQTPGATLCEPFAHPRCLISDFLVAEAFLQHALRSIVNNGWLSPAPHCFLHPCPSPEQAQGGLTFVEHRALRDLGHSCGASSTEVVQNIPLTEAQIHALLHPR